MVESVGFLAEDILNLPNSRTFGLTVDNIDDFVFDLGCLAFELLVCNIRCTKSYSFSQLVNRINETAVFP